jgi:hypothetical protein
MSTPIIVLGEATPALLKFALENDFEVIICKENLLAKELDEKLLYHQELIAHSKTLDIYAMPIIDEEYISRQFPQSPTKEQRRNWRKYGK